MDDRELLSAEVTISPALAYYPPGASYGPRTLTDFELVRLERARTMLARSNLTVSQVASACGFADPLYFSRRFGAAHGIAPSAYRDNGAAGVPPELPGLPSLARRLAPE